MRLAPPVIVALMVVCGKDLRAADSSPFDDAAIAPAGVQLYVHIEDAAGLRRELGERPIACWIRARLAQGDIHRAWNSLAREAGFEPDRLFDLTLGERFTVLTRDHAPGHAIDHDPPSQWALLTRVPADASRELMRRLRTKARGPQHGLAIHELPEHAIILAAGEDVLVAGPIDHAALFEDVLRCLEAPLPGRTLRGDAALALAGELGAGRVGVFARHEAPLGGWSAIVSDLRGDEVTIRHRAHFDRPPFSAPPSDARFDLAPIEALEEHAIIAIAEPAEAGDGLLGTFLAMQLPIMTPELHARVGARRLLVLGESDGRRLDPPSDVLVPTIARCYELKEGMDASVAADTAMLGFIEHLNDAGGGEYHIAAPTLKAPANQPRSADVGPAASSLLRGLPVAGHVSLNWQIAGGGGHGDWFVVASDPDLLRDVARALEEDRESGDSPHRAAWASAGVIHGPRVAQHIRTWLNVPGLAEGADEAFELRAAIEPLVDLGDCLRTTRWCLTRPTVNTMRLELSVILAGADSTEPASRVP